KAKGCLRLNPATLATGGSPAEEEYHGRNEQVWPRQYGYRTEFIRRLDQERASHSIRGCRLFEEGIRGLCRRVGKADWREEPGKGHRGAERVPQILLRGLHRTIDQAR